MGLFEFPGILARYARIQKVEGNQHRRNGKMRDYAFGFSVVQKAGDVPVRNRIPARILGCLTKIPELPADI